MIQRSLCWRWQWPWCLWWGWWYRWWWWRTRMPILSIFLAKVMPGESMGTQISDLFLWAARNRCSKGDCWKESFHTPKMWLLEKKGFTGSRRSVGEHTHPVRLESMMIIALDILNWNKTAMIILLDVSNLNLEPICDPHLLPVDHQVVTIPSRAIKIGSFQNSYFKIQISNEDMLFIKFKCTREDF